MRALDTFNDEFCLFRCSGVHLGGRVDCCNIQTKELAKSLFNDNPVTPLTSDMILAFQTHFNQGVAVYKMTDNRKLFF